MNKAGEQPTITQAVIQADRDAAADYCFKHENAVWWMPEAIHNGQQDEAPLVQAFARHRTTSLAAQDGLVEALEAMREPTDEMLTAALETSTRFGKPAMKRIWQNMIDAKVSAIKGDKS